MRLVELPGSTYRPPHGSALPRDRHQSPSAVSVIRCARAAEPPRRRSRWARDDRPPASPLVSVARQAAERERDVREGDPAERRACRVEHVSDLPGSAWRRHGTTCGVRRDAPPVAAHHVCRPQHLRSLSIQPRSRHRDSPRATDQIVLLRLDEATPRRHPLLGPPTQPCRGPAAQHFRLRFRLSGGGVSDLLLVGARRPGRTPAVTSTAADRRAQQSPTMLHPTKLHPRAANRITRVGSV